jgi:Toastrack DUF4097
MNVGTERAEIFNANRFRGIRPACLLSLAFVVPVGLALAVNPPHVEKTLTFSTNLNPRISLVNLEGRVLVRAWEKPEVHALCSTSSPRVTFESDPSPASGSTDRVRLATHVQDPMLAGQDASADYTLDVPADSSIEIRNRQGLVRIEKIAGDIWIESVGGNVVVSDTAGHTAVRTVGGDIEIIRSVGRVEVSSVTGNLHFVSPTSSRLHANTTSGKILYEGDFVPGGDYVFSEYSGEMDIVCPVDSDFDMNARSVRGKVLKDPEFSLFTPKSKSNSVAGAHSSLVSPARPVLELTSFSGNIRIRHQQ